MNIEWNTVTWYSMLLAVIVFVGSFALGMYLGMAYQGANDRVTITNQAARITQLLQRPAPAVATSTPESKPLHLLTINVPGEGAVLCRGTKIQIGWQANAPIDQVRVNLEAPNPFSPFGQYPASWNDSGVKNMGTLEWVVGTYTMNNATYQYPDGSNYRIRMDGLSKGDVIEHEQSGLFTIQTCQG